MKSTEVFKQTIKSYLDKRAAEDELFAFTYSKEGKSLDKCIDYIFNTVQESGCNGFTDDEIFGMAVHYYDEDNIKVADSPFRGSVVVNHKVELTEEDRLEARQKAIDDLIAEERRKLTHKPVKTVGKPEAEVQQVSLF